MTVSKSIAAWLKGYEMKIVKVDTDQVGEGADSLGIFKSPNRDVQNYNDSSYLITEYYQLFVVRDSHENRDREGNDEWLENFAYWVDDCQYNGDFPKLDNNRVCTYIALAGTPYMFGAKKDNTALYQISLKITYSRKREVKRRMVRKDLIGLFLNTGTKTEPVWTRIKKSTELTISMNPETEDFDYIADENPTTEIKKYKPTIDQDLTMYKDEDDYKMMWPYFYEMKTGSDAHIDCMVVFMHEGDAAKGYSAWKTDSVLSVQDLNAVESKLNFQIMFGGTIEKGTATKANDTITFTDGGTA